MPVNWFRMCLSGRVGFTVTGGFPSLFLEACAARGVSVGGIRPGKDGLSAYVSEKDFRDVMLAARHAGMALTETRRTGLPRLLRRCRARVGVPIGLLLAALLLTFLSGRIWEVTVAGNERVGSDEILDVMEELGVFPGAGVRALDLKAVELAAQERLPQLSWIAVNLVGSKATVEVREIIKTPELTDERDYANIVAAQDGVVVSADVLKGSGQPLVGSAVVKGDLLVSGVIEMKTGFRRFVNAKAIIKAFTRTTLTAQTPLSLEAERISAYRDVRGITFFGLRIPFGIRIGNAQTETEAYLLQSRTTVFPVGVTHTRCALFETQTLALSKADAALLCFADFCSLAHERYRDAELRNREISFTIKNGTARVTARCECVEEIGERQPFAVDDRR